MPYLNSEWEAQTKEQPVRPLGKEDSKGVQEELSMLN